MRRYDLPYVVKHVYNHAITWTHLSAKNEDEAIRKVNRKYPGTNIICTKLDGVQ